MRSLTLKNFLLFGIAAVFIILLIFFLIKLNEKPAVILPTYFHYTEEELAPIRSLQPSKNRITQQDLFRWDEEVFDLVRQNQYSDVDASRLFAYYFTAQRDMAYISHNLQNEFVGCIDTVSMGVLCIFFPQDCSTFPKEENPDIYSRAIANIVLNKVKKRIKEEKAQKIPYQEHQNKEFWHGKHPYLGQAAGSWKPWIMTSGSQFRAPPPPLYGQEEWKNQLKLVQEARNNITDEQKKAVIYWAGGPGTLTPTGLWLDLANSYMWKQHLPIEKILMVQSSLAMGMADAVIAAFDSKYTYESKRPIEELEIKTIMPTPNYPSYPAAHSAISMAAAKILSYFFPQEKQHWKELAHESSNSRLWGGLHLPVDLEQGEIMGKHSAETVIKYLENTKHLQKDRK